jgi:hypothetical protein
VLDNGIFSDDELIVLPPDFLPAETLVTVSTDGGILSSSANYVAILRNVPVGSEIVWSGTLAPVAGGGSATPQPTLVDNVLIVPFTVSAVEAFPVAYTLGVYTFSVSVNGVPFGSFAIELTDP